jgi:hypothetical protein
MCRVTSVMAAMFLALTCGTASAQFVGDVFAKVPSQAAQAGGQATVEVQLFSGANVFGASIIQLTFQATELGLREVLLTGTLGERRVAVDRQADGRVEIATFSVDGTANPIGTVTLAQVVFDVLAAPGTTARYRITPREVITQSEARFSTLRGADGEVVVVSAMGARGAASSPPRVSDRESVARAAAVRPRGGVVDLVVPVKNGMQVVPQVVRVQQEPTTSSSD